MPPLVLAYYCSGHGYGHATRVSAFSRHLRGLPEGSRPTVYIVSSAPQHIFADSIACGALYRYAQIDPVIVQPLAYRVDRQKSIDVLKSFLDKKEVLLERECRWLLSVKANSVLSDAAFLGCLAAKAAGIQSILITNFTFDSVYSYLSTSISDNVDSPQGGLAPDGLAPDKPVSNDELVPLVEQIHAGYRCADLLLLLPGCIPIPSFSEFPPLPSADWVDVNTQRLMPEIATFLSKDPSSYTLLPSLPFPFSASPSYHPQQRAIIPAPLLVRPPSTKCSVYTQEGRAKFLTSIGVPSHLHDPKTKILIVSFGGQVIRKPSRPGSRTSSQRQSRSHSPEPKLKANASPVKASPLQDKDINSQVVRGWGSTEPFTTHIPDQVPLTSRVMPLCSDSSDDEVSSSRLATTSHIWVPGAPPAWKPPPTPTHSDVPFFTTIPHTLSEASATVYVDLDADDAYDADAPRLLPDASWIAIVCGVSKEQWVAQCEDEDSELPDGFYVAPKNLYMPDLTAIGDVLLGKLGYGTVSECVDACTPFVFVSRPLFVEEHGLRLLLDNEGVGVELSRQSYEAGDWAAAVSEAWIKGDAAKRRKRDDMAKGIGADRRDREGRKMAQGVVDWVNKWTASGDGNAEAVNAIVRN